MYDGRKLDEGLATVRSPTCAGKSCCILGKLWLGDWGLGALGPAAVRSPASLENVNDGSNLDAEDVEIDALAPVPVPLLAGVGGKSRAGVMRTAVDDVVGDRGRFVLTALFAGGYGARWNGRAIVRW